MKWQQCPTCGKWYPPHLMTAAFPHKGKNGCLGCLRKKGHDYKQSKPWTNKARAILRTHAISLAIPREELRFSFGWDEEQIANEAEAAYALPCPYCGLTYIDRNDLTLDIIHDEPPFWGANTQWICGRCNREKHQLGAVEFARRLQVMEIFRGEKVSIPPMEVLTEVSIMQTLFDL